LNLYVRESIEAVIAHVDGGGDFIANVQGVELGFGFHRVIHRHRFHEIRDSGSVDGGSLVFRIEGNYLAGELIVMLNADFGTSAAGGKEENENE
jgi:hypothetical protein